jgi:hypothetical protein
MWITLFLGPQCFYCTILGCNICGGLFRKCYINDLHTTTCSGMPGHRKKEPTLGFSESSIITLSHPRGETSLAASLCAWSPNEWNFEEKSCCHQECFSHHYWGSNRRFFTFVSFYFALDFAIVFLFSFFFCCY